MEPKENHTQKASNLMSMGNDLKVNTVVTETVLEFSNGGDIGILDKELDTLSPDERIRIKNILHGFNSSNYGEASRSLSRKYVSYFAELTIIALSIIQVLVQ